MPSDALAAALDPAEALAAAQTDILEGRAGEAVPVLKGLVQALGPDNPMPRYWLAAALKAAGDDAGHAACLREAEDLHALKLVETIGGDVARMQVDPAYAMAVGNSFYEHGHVAAASACYARADAAASPSAPILASLGLSLQHQGRIEEAVDAFSRAHDAFPDAPQIHSFLLYALFYVEDGVRRHAEQARAWRARYGQPPRPARYDNRPLEGRRLKLGYVLPSLGQQARPFLLPVLESHDRERVHTTLYLQGSPAGPAPADKVRVIGGLDDAAAAERIRADGVDVLVDLWGHTAGGRLGVFVRKPAPVQVSWLNYVQTTGVPEIDWLIHADCMDVDGAQDHCAETIWRLGPVISPFRPDPRPEPTPTPALVAGHVTFGSYNHPARLNDATIAAWAEILKRTPGSRLALRYRYFVDEVLQNAVLMRFAACGIGPDRIDFFPSEPQPAYYQSYAGIDIALDPSPCPGGTTSLDAVANGVPVLTLAGPDYFSRIGVAVVGPLGLDELVAADWDDYVARAVRLASDLPALDALRRRVREAFDASGRRDEAGFTRRLEDAYREMFVRWRAGRSQRSAA